MFYKIVLYNNGVLYRLHDGFSEGTKFTKKFILKNYFPQIKTGIFHKNNKDFLVFTDILDSLITLHSIKGNELYVTDLKKLNQCNNITMIASNACSKNTWEIEQDLLSAFFADPEYIAGPNIVFIDKDLYKNNSPQPCTEEEYNVFYDSICDLCTAVWNNYHNWQQDQKPKVLPNPVDDPSKVTVRYPEEIKIVMDGQNDFVVSNYQEVQRFLTESIYDELYYSHGAFCKVDLPNTRIAVIAKPGIIYFGDESNGHIEGYIGYRMEKKYNC